MLSMISSRDATTALFNINDTNKELANSIKALTTGKRTGSISDMIAVMGNMGSATEDKVKLANIVRTQAMLEVVSSTLNQVTEIMQRQKVLAVQASSSAVSESDRIYLSEEFTQLSKQANEMIKNLKFGDLKIFRDNAFNADTIYKAGGIDRFDLHDILTYDIAKSISNVFDGMW